MFVAFEGVEGAGKSTQAGMLATRIESELGRSVILTREPGGTDLAEELRSLVLTHRGELLDPRTEALIMVAARAHHVSQVIAPGLRSGSFVLCDRFSGSYLAYQGYGRGLDLGILRDITHFASASIEPDVTYFLRVDPAVGFARKGMGADRIEAEPREFFEKVAQGYSELCVLDGWAVLDASQSPEDLHEQIFAHLVVTMQSFGEK